MSNGTRWGLAGAALLALALLWGGAARVAAAPGGMPVASSPGLVISEVYAPQDSTPAQQWIELHNMRADVGYPLNGLILGTSTVSVTLQTTMTLGASGFAVVVFDPANPLAKRPNALVLPTLGGLNPAADAVLLYAPDGLPIDTMNWGDTNRAWPNYNDALWTHGLAPLPRTTDPTHPHSWGRTAPPAADRDTDQPEGDWTIHETVSPGGNVPPPPEHNGPYLSLFTNVIGVISGILLWAAFIIVGVIAYRFERLRETRTYWQLLLLAPSGILFYTFIVAQGFTTATGALTDDQKWLSFPILAASAVACLLAVGIFQNVARTLLEGE